MFEIQLNKSYFIYVMQYFFLHKFNTIFWRCKHFRHIFIILFYWWMNMMLLLLIFLCFINWFMFRDSWFELRFFYTNNLLNGLSTLLKIMLGFAITRIFSWGLWRVLLFLIHKLFFNYSISLIFPLYNAIMSIIN